MNAPVIRMGLIPVGPAPAPVATGHSVSFTPAYGGMYNSGGYGKIGVRCGFRNTAWIPKDSRLKQCPAMRKAYNKWTKAASDHIKRFGRTSGCLKPGAIDSAKKLAALEAEGKQAWNMCKVGRKAEGVTQQYQPSNAGPGGGGGGGGGGAIDPTTGLPYDPAALEAAGYGEEEGGSSMGLWLGVGVLLIATGGIIWYKKKKGKKGKKKGKKSKKN